MSLATFSDDRNSSKHKTQEEKLKVELSCQVFDFYFFCFYLFWVLGVLATCGSITPICV